MRLLATLVFAAGCTIDPGPQLEPPQTTCNPAPAQFVEPNGVWDAYFDHYNCAASGCHDASTGHGFLRFSSVASVARPAPSTPLAAWPAAWSANFMAVERFISCANPAASDALTYPENQMGEHPGGTVIASDADRMAAAALFEMWLK